jgi:transcriptional regulator with PAS, ATPase and Fis domain
MKSYKGEYSVLSKTQFESYEDIFNSLNKSFDFSKQNQRREFEKLISQRNNMESNFLPQKSYTIIGGAFSTPRYWDNYNKSYNQFAFFDIGKILRSNVRIERGGIEHLNADEVNVIVILHPSAIEKLLINSPTSLEYGIIKNVGDYTETKNSQGITVYLLNAMNISDVNNKYELMKGFDQLIQSLLSGSSKYKIFFPFNESEFVDDHTNVIFYFFLIHIVNTIINHPTLEVSFVFNQNNIKRTFENISIKIRDNEKINSSYENSSKQIINELISKALTQDTNYITQLESLAKIINEDFPLLILGESGVGKTVLAHEIHKLSLRKDAKFEGQNCGALVPDRLEQNLFGWVKGAFTDAKNDKKGKVKIAEGGTLFLDEIDRAHISVRNALLTFIEDRRYTPIGADEEKTADVRLIFGSNKDLKKLVKRNEIERDFYERIKNKSLTIPPLRNRINDVDLIIDFNLEKLSKKKQRIITIEKTAIETLKNYSWPGNVRELSRYIETIFYECVADDKDLITAKMIFDTPFENLGLTELDDLENLIILLKKFLDNWDINNGDIQHKLIAPIIAKLYVDDAYKHWNKTKKYTEAMKIVGMDGKTFNSSTLQRFYDDFQQIRKVLGLED